jgi:hypothetical protein
LPKKQADEKDQLARMGRRRPLQMEERSRDKLGVRTRLRDKLYYKGGEKR